MYQTLSHRTNNEKTDFSKNIVIFFNSCDRFGIPARNNNLSMTALFYDTQVIFNDLIQYLKNHVLIFGYLHGYFW